MTDPREVGQALSTVLGYIQKRNQQKRSADTLVAAQKQGADVGMSYNSSTGAFEPTVKFMTPYEQMYNMYRTQKMQDYLNPGQGGETPAQIAANIKMKFYRGERLTPEEKRFWDATYPLNTMSEEFMPQQPVGSETLTPQAQSFDWDNFWNIVSGAARTTADVGGRLINPTAPRLPTNIRQPILSTPAIPAQPAADNGRVVVIAPDGTQGHIPKSQLQDAIQQGYKLAR